MAEEQTPDGDTQVAEGGAQGGESESDRRSRVDRRNAELSSEVKDLKAKLGEIEPLAQEAKKLRDQKQKVEEQKAKDEGRWQDVLKTRETERDEYKSKFDELAKENAQLKNERLERTILDGIVPTSTGNPNLVRAAYRDMVETHGLDRFPAGEDGKPLTAKQLQKLVDERRAKLAEHVPDLFQGRPGGGSPPGAGVKTTKNSPGGLTL
jgi:DNA repair exonuclease SbcCD ATPase subunit